MDAPTVKSFLDWYFLHRNSRILSIAQKAKNLLKYLKITQILIYIIIYF